MILSFKGPVSFKIIFVPWHYVPSATHRCERALVAVSCTALWVRYLRSFKVVTSTTCQEIAQPSWICILSRCPAGACMVWRPTLELSWHSLSQDMLWFRGATTGKKISKSSRSGRKCRIYHEYYARELQTKDAHFFSKSRKQSFDCERCEIQQFKIYVQILIRCCCRTLASFEDNFKHVKAPAVFG